MLKSLAVGSLALLLAGCAGLTQKQEGILATGAAGAGLGAIAGGVIVPGFGAPAGAAIGGGAGLVVGAIMSPDEDKKPQEPVGGDLPLFEGEQHGYYDEEGNYHGTYRGGYIQQVPSEAR